MEMEGWTKASYSENETQTTCILTTLVPVDSPKDRYNLYRCDNGRLVTVFEDQKELKKLVEEHVGSLFGIRLLSYTNNKYKYLVDGEEAFTVSRACVLIPCPTGNPLSLRVYGNVAIVD